VGWTTPRRSPLDARSIPTPALARGRFLHAAIERQRRDAYLHAALSGFYGIVTFNNVGRMSAVRDRWGNTTTFTYTGPGQLASIKDPLVSGDTAVTTFVYNSGSFTIEPPGPRGIGQSTTRAGHRL